MIIREMKPEDYDQIYSMWQITSKRALSEADSRQGIEKYLARNPGMSMVAEIDGKIVGTVLAGHDGRRGFIHHMAVMPQFRRHGIGKKLAKAATDKIFEDGIDKIHIFCYYNIVVWPLREKKYTKSGHLFPKNERLPGNLPTEKKKSLGFTKS